MPATTTTPVTPLPAPTPQPWMTVVLLGAILFMALKGCNPTNPDSPNPPNPPPVVVIQKPTAATYVYEKDTTAVPSGVMAGLNRLNLDRLGDSFIASVFEQDTVDGDGEIPDQYKVALKSAKDSGLPALVVTSGLVVLKVVKNPQTEQDVIGALAP